MLKQMSQDTRTKMRILSLMQLMGLKTSKHIFSTSLDTTKSLTVKLLKRKRSRAHLKA